MLVPLQGKGIPGLGNSPLPLRAQTRQGGWDGSHRKTLILPFVVAGFSQFSGLDEEMMELVTGQNMYEEIAGAGVLFTFLVGMKPGMIFPTKVTPKLTKSGKVMGEFFIWGPRPLSLNPPFSTVDSQGEVRGGCATSSTAGRRRDEYANPGAASAEPCHVMTWFNTGWAGDITTQWVCLEANYTKIGSAREFCLALYLYDCKYMHLCYWIDIISSFKLFQSYQDE